MKKKKAISAPEEISRFDPDGSYTGVPEIPTEQPVQDVDDL